MTTSSDLIRAARLGLGSTLDGRPKRRLAVVTCMDARVDPWRLLRAGVGDMHVIRNAGGVVTDDVIRSLSVSTMRFGTNQVQLVMHTDCGMLGFDESSFRRDMQDMAGMPPPWPMMGFDDLEAEVARGVDLLRSSPMLTAVERISGHVFDVRTGRMETVAA